MVYKLKIVGVLALILLLLTLSACDVSADTSPTAINNALLPISTNEVCVACAQATLDAVMTEQQSGIDASAAATAEVMRANAQATLNSVSATLSADRAQQQANADIISASLAATAEIDRANAHATMAAAESTQRAASTQDANHQAQVQFDLQMTAGIATQNANATAMQQNNNVLAAATQTAVANLIATQTQAAVATSQWYTDQDRRRAEKMQEQFSYLWLLCPGLIIVAFIIVGIFLLIRWMNIQYPPANIDTQPEQPAPDIYDVQPTNHFANPPVQMTKPTDHVRRWLDEVKRKL